MRETHNKPRVVLVTSATAYTTGVSIYRSLQRVADVMVISDTDEIPSTVRSSRGAQIEELIRDVGFDPDLLLFVEGGSMRLFPRNVQLLSCPTAWYGIDTHMDIEKHLAYARMFKQTYVAQREYVSVLKDNSSHNSEWLPLAFDTDLAPYEATDLVYDVSFVGSLDSRIHPERTKLIERLDNLGLRTFFGRTTATEMYRIYAQSRVVFNKSVNNDLNMRYFEAIGSGALLLTDRIQNNGRKELFKIDRDYIDYTPDTFEADVERALKLSETVDRAERIQPILEAHTYDHRADRIVGVALDSSNSSQRFVLKSDEAYVALSVGDYRWFRESVLCLLNRWLKGVARTLFRPVRSGFVISVALVGLVRRLRAFRRRMSL